MLTVMTTPRPFHWWRSAGVWTCALAAVHVAATPLVYGDSVRSVLDAGVLGALDRDPALADVRGASFYFLTAGVMLGALGVGVARHERREGTAPAGFAAFMAVTGLGGVLITPASGFWAFFPIAALALLRRNRHARAAVDAPHGERGATS